MSQSSQQSFWQSFFLDTWYNKRWWAWLLLPLAWLYQCLSFVHRHFQKKKTIRLSVPVVIIGNISVGGTGKTPVIIALANALHEQGVFVGIISRGYGSNAPSYPYHVNTDDNASVAGDEPLLIAQATQCPIVIGQDRVAAGRALIHKHPQVSLLLSDDGLQHDRLGRDMEVVVIDGERGLGNHFCLPAGPLREPAKRLASVDWVLLNQHASVELSQKNTVNHALAPIYLAPTAWRHIESQTVFPLQPLPWAESNQHQTPIMMAGIGHPQRFFKTLTAMGIEGEACAFDDHYQYTNNDFALWQERVVLMTEKDAVKCQTIAHPQLWSLRVEMTLPDAFIAGVAQLVQTSAGKAASTTITE